MRDYRIEKYADGFVIYYGMTRLVISFELEYYDEIVRKICSDGEIVEIEDCDESYHG